MIDLYTKFLVVEIMKTTNVNTVIDRLERVFSMLGYPTSIKRDNGPPFSSHEFKKYLNVSVNIIDAPITP